MNSREKAKEFVETHMGTTPYIYWLVDRDFDKFTLLLAKLLDSHAAEQREACGKEAFLMAIDLDCNGMISRRIEKACLAARTDDGKV